VAGELEIHRSLEKALAEWLGTEDALLFNSGYAANVGALSALGGSDCVVISDALNHASIIDGCRLSRAQVVVTPHLDVEAVGQALARAQEERRRAIVATDAYFSMDGDVADLRALRDLCNQFDATLFVDEAHALGVMGPEGRGACAIANVQPDVLVGTLGKSFGAAGAFVAGSASLTSWLWNRARSFVFSTGIAPTNAAAALLALPSVRGPELRARLARNSDGLRAALAGAGVEVAAGSTGPIIPLVVGEAERALAAATTLRAAGIHAQAIRPPTVPPGTARLRLTAQAGHELDDLQRAAHAIAEALR
jgi:8-amino-7-oxononanoate synthase